MSESGRGAWLLAVGILCGLVAMRWGSTWFAEPSPVPRETPSVTATPASAADRADAPVIQKDHGEVDDPAAPSTEDPSRAPPAATEDEALATAPAQVMLKRYELASGIIEAGFVPEDESIEPGESTEITFRVINRGQQPISFWWGGDYRGSVRPTSFSISAVDAKGIVVEDPHPENVCFGGLMWQVTLEPEGVHEHTLQLENWVLLPDDRLGNYTVRCSRVLDFDPDLANDGKHAIEIETTFELSVFSFSHKYHNHSTLNF